MFDRALLKNAKLTVQRASLMNPSRLLAESVGRVIAAPGNIGLRPQSPIQATLGRTPTEEDVEDDADFMQKAEPSELDHTLLRLGGTNTLQDVGRIWKNQRTTLPGKLLSTAALPGRVFTNLGRDASRTNHYDPATDTAVVYMPGDHGQTANQLGRARDYNRHGPWVRDAYRALDLAPYAIGLPGHGVDVLKHFLGNERALDAARATGSPDEKAQREAKLWKLMAPSVGMPVGGAMGMPIGAIAGALAGAPGGPASMLAGAGLGAAGGTMAGGAIGAGGGHAVAWIRNRLAARRLAREKEEEEKRRTREGVEKSSSFNMLASLLPGLLHGPGSGMRITRVSICLSKALSCLASPSGSASRMDGGEPDEDEEEEDRAPFGESSATLGDDGGTADKKPEAEPETEEEAEDLFDDQEEYDSEDLDLGGLDEALKELARGGTDHAPEKSAAQKEEIQEEEEDQEPAEPVTPPRSSSPIADHLRDMAGLKPGERFWDKPLRSTANFATTPVFDPWVRKNNPNLANALKIPFTLLPAVSAGLGAYHLLHGAAGAVRGATSELGRTFSPGDPVERKAIEQRALLATPGITAKSVLPGALGGDPTVIGDAHRSALYGAAVPYLRDQADWYTRYGPPIASPLMSPDAQRRHGPTISKAFDVIRSMSPFGLASTIATRALAKPYGSGPGGKVDDAALRERISSGASPPERNMAAGEALGRRDNWFTNRLLAGGAASLMKASPEIAADPDQVFKSPLLRTYANIIGDKALADPVQRREAFDQFLNRGYEHPGLLSDSAHFYRNGPRDFTSGLLWGNNGAARPTYSVGRIYDDGRFEHRYTRNNAPFIVGRHAHRDLDVENRVPFEDRRRMTRLSNRFLIEPHPDGYNDSRQFGREPLLDALERFRARAAGGE